MGTSPYFIGVVLNIPRKATLAQVGETVVSRCFVGCLGQARKRCSNRCCYGLRNYPSDVRPTDPLTCSRCRVPKSQASSRSCVLHFYCCSNCRAKIYWYFFNQPSNRGGSSLVRHAKCLTFLLCIVFLTSKINWTSKRDRSGR